MRINFLSWISAFSLVFAATASAIPPSALVESHLQLDDTNVFDLVPGDLLDSGDQFGHSMAAMGDFDGDGVEDIIVGARNDDDGGTNDGAVYILLLNTDGSIKAPSPYKISEPNLPAGSPSLSGDFLGWAIAWLGDYDMDGNGELALTEAHKDTPTDSGRLWIIDLDANAVPQSQFTVTTGSTNFTTLGSGDRFGYSMANVGDWNGDGAPELALGALFDDDGGTDNGAVYILYLDPDPLATEILGYSKISATEGGYTGGFDPATWFGSSVTAIGDLDDDGQIDLAVGARRRRADGGVFILFMDPACQTLAGTGLNPACVVKPAVQEIGEGLGGFQETLTGDEFGGALAWLPDPSGIVGDRLAVGEHLGDIGGGGSGHVWILTLAPDGRVTSARRIAEGENTTADLGGNFGLGLAAPGDLNEDGIPDLVVGAPLRDITVTTGSDLGAAYVMFMSPCPIAITSPVVFHSPDDDGVNKCQPLTIDSASETLHLYLDPNPVASTNPGDICVEDLGDGGEVCAFDVRVSLTGGATIQSFSSSLVDLISNNPASGSQELRLNWIGTPTTPPVPIKLGDLLITSDLSPSTVVVGEGSAAVDAALGLRMIPASSLGVVPEPGAAVGIGAGLLALVGLARRRAHRSRGMASITLLLFMLMGSILPDLSHAGISVQDFVTIGTTEGGLTPTVGSGSEFGYSMAQIDDLDGNGVRDLAIGASGSPSCTIDPGRLFIVFLGDDGRAIGFETITGDAGHQDFGFAVANLGDFDGNGVSDLIVTAGGGYTGRCPNPAFFIVLLNPDGTELSRIEIASGVGGFPDILSDDDAFGHDTTVLGDIDGDGNVEIVVTARYDRGLQTNDDQYGAIYIISLDATTGTVAWYKKFGHDQNLPWVPAEKDRIGTSVTSIDDLDGDGVVDLAVGVGGLGSSFNGGVVVLFLESSGPGDVDIKSHQFITSNTGGLPFNIPNGTAMGSGVAWQPAAEGNLGTLYAASSFSVNEGIYGLRLNADGTVGSHYKLCNSCGVGFSGNPSIYRGDIQALDDVNGDEMLDLVFGDPFNFSISTGHGLAFLLHMLDSDFDRFDDNVDNCPGGPGLDPQEHYNPLQEDEDGDGVGDLCDVCPTVPDPAQGDVDMDGVGDLCEPVVVSLEPTSLPGAPPVWDVLIECGAWGVTEANFAVIPPETGANPALSLTCPAPPAGGICATTDIGNSTVTGPGLTLPIGVRDDAFYLHLEGNGTGGQLCQTLDLPAKIGELGTDPITGTTVAAASLGEEGIGLPGLGLAIANDTSGAIPITEIEFATGLPQPKVTLRLGPAVVTGGDTRWEVLLTGATDLFHRVAFGLVAPFGTSTADMRFVGCDGVTAEPGEVRTCSAGLGASVNPNRSWTIGPVTLANTPTGLKEHTLYIVAEGSIGVVQPYLNYPLQTVVLGTIELTGTPDLEPALTLEGVDLIDDRLGAGSIVPFERAFIGPVADLDEVKLVGQFNPADDLDGDGVQDLADNCPFIANADQADVGGFQSPEGDAVGNACQCGDGSGDGIVQASASPQDDDVLQLREFLLGNITNPILADAIEAKCSVAGTPECNIRDVFFLRDSLQATSAVETRCDGALAPAVVP